MRTATANGLPKADARYRALIRECLQEFRTIQRELRRSRAATERSRVASRRIMKETRDILRRVETTL
jgi:hypothetical protein